MAGEETLMICSLSFSSFFFLGFYFRLFSIYAPSCVVFSCILVLVFFFFCAMPFNEVAIGAKISFV